MNFNQFQRVFNIEFLTNARKSEIFLHYHSRSKMKSQLRIAASSSSREMLNGIVMLPSRHKIVTRRWFAISELVTLRSNQKGFRLINGHATELVFSLCGFQKSVGVMSVKFDVYVFEIIKFNFDSWGFRHRGFCPNNDRYFQIVFPSQNPSWCRQSRLRRGSSWSDQKIDFKIDFSDCEDL